MNALAPVQYQIQRNSATKMRKYELLEAKTDELAFGYH